MNWKRDGTFTCDEMSRKYIESAPDRPIEDDFQDLNDY